MKKKLIFLPVIALVSFGFILQKNPDEVRKTPKLSYETPPGTVWLHDNLFIDQAEVRNLDYLEFLYWTNKREPGKLKEILPDTLVWRDSSFYNEPYVDYYLRHPAYRDYPVVGISYEQAVAFCKWRSDRVNEFIYIREHKIKGNAYNPDSIYPHPEVMRFRLPTKEEWEFAAAAGLDQDQYAYGYESLIDKNGMPVSNTIEYRNLYTQATRFAYRHTGGYYDKEPDAGSPVNAFRPNKYGIYNMTGNVSEMISDRRFKGLNYSTSLDGSTFKSHPKEYIRTDSTKYNYDNRFTFQYRQPKAWLGFRCVCEVLKETGK
jgi:formylglycine-generating enzyme required for sulfatase activity